jgi:hypothetical protein
LGAIEGAVNVRCQDISEVLWLHLDRETISLDPSVVHLRGERRDGR